MSKLKNVLLKIATTIVTLLFAPFMLIYLSGAKIVQGVKFLINKIKGN